MRHVAEPGTLRRLGDKLNGVRLLTKALTRQLVRRAVEICGNKRTLAVLLNVTVEEINSWTDGRAALPDDVYPHVADLLADLEQEELRRVTAKGD